jgi:SPW repeat
MKSQQLQHLDNDWQDPMIVIIGIWLFISPFILHFITTNPGAAIVSFFFGVLLQMFAVTGLSTHKTWGEWSILLLAAILIGLPWILGFSKPAVMWNVMLVGGLVAFFAIWSIIQMRSESHHDSHVSSA